MTLHVTEMFINCQARAITARQLVRHQNEGGPTVASSGPAADGGQTGWIASIPVFPTAHRLHNFWRREKVTQQLQSIWLVT